MLCQFFSTSRLLLFISAVSFQPLTYLLGLRVAFPLLFLTSYPLLLLESSCFFPLQVHLLVLTAAFFFLLPNYFRLFATLLFFLLKSQSQLLLSNRLSFAFPLLCQPMPRRFPYGSALLISRSCHCLLPLCPALFPRLDTPVRPVLNYPLSLL